MHRWNLHFVELKSSFEHPIIWTCRDWQLEVSQWNRNWWQRNPWRLVTATVSFFATFVEPSGTGFIALYNSRFHRVVLKKKDTISQNHPLSRPHYANDCERIHGGTVRRWKLMKIIGIQHHLWATKSQSPQRHSLSNRLELDFAKPQEKTRTNW